MTKRQVTQLSGALYLAGMFFFVTGGLWVAVAAFVVMIIGAFALSIAYHDKNKKPVPTKIAIAGSIGAYLASRGVDVLLFSEPPTVLSVQSQEITALIMLVIGVIAIACCAYHVIK